jgi:hypothetical protein
VSKNLLLIKDKTFYFFLEKSNKKGFAACHPLEFYGCASSSCGAQWLRSIILQNLCLVLAWLMVLAILHQLPRSSTSPRCNQHTQEFYGYALYAGGVRVWALLLLFGYSVAGEQLTG